MFAKQVCSDVEIKLHTSRCSHPLTQAIFLRQSIVYTSQQPKLMYQLASIFAVWVHEIIEGWGVQRVRMYPLPS